MKQWQSFEDNAVAFLAAKCAPRGEAWLPLWLHSLDTLRVMEYLLESWLPDSIFRSSCLSEREFRQIARLLAVSHDLGKATLSFQSRITERLLLFRRRLNALGLETPGLDDPDLLHRERLPHAAAGEILLYLYTGERSAAEILGAHHGRPWSEGGKWLDLLDEISPEEAMDAGDTWLLWGNRKRREGWRAAQQEVFAWMMRQGGAECGNWPSQSPIDEGTQILLTGLVIMADWIASNTAYFPLISVTEEKPVSLPRRWKDGIGKLNLPPAWETDGSVDLSTLAQTRFGFAANAVQEAMLKAVASSQNPGIMILEAPMGIGKTEAALLSAEGIARRHIGGIFFGLPTQATANGIFGRVLAWGKSQSQNHQASIRLAHGMADLQEDYRALLDAAQPVYVSDEEGGSAGLVAHEWFQGSKQALLADFVIGTVDQVLMASLKQRHFMLRHLGLAGKVVIIDECHAYDAYMNHYLERTLSWLGKYHTPVIMLSATLPCQRRAALIDAYRNRRRKVSAERQEAWREARAYPLLTWTDEKGVNQLAIQREESARIVRVKRLCHGEGIQKQVDAAMPLLESAVREGGCAGVILNTVARAQAFAEALREALPEARVLLLHASLMMPDRIQREAWLLQWAGKGSNATDRRGLIVVGTQVMEQSLDYDVDVMVTDLCPMDLLLQRMGRLHRHASHDTIRPAGLQEPRCYVLCAQGALDPGGEAVYGAYLLMRTQALLPESIRLPEDIPDLVQNVYDEGVSLGEIPDGYAAAEMAYRLQMQEKETNARAFSIHAPDTFETFSKILDSSIPADEAHARAQVRDGETVLDVLVLQQRRGGVGLLFEQGTSEEWSTAVCPAEPDCRRIAAQRLRLPRRVSDTVLRGSGMETLGMPDAWLASPWLRNERLLLLDENLEAMVTGYRLRYSREFGLTYTREEM